MSDDAHVIDKGWDTLPEYVDKGDADDAVTVSVSTAAGEWLVNTSDSVVVPMSMAEVVDALRCGTLTERSLVWRQGMQEWSHVGAVPQLKLAARLPRRAQQTPAAEKSQAAHPPAPQMLSRRSTLPFGLPAPTGSRPAHAKPVAAPAPPVSDEPEVLAVYARPAATISFDLSPEQPLRAPPPVAGSAAAAVSMRAPQTLAPTTSDSAPRSISPHRSSDLSVVAAAEYRAVRRSGKRQVLFWSLSSAAAASVLTFLLSHSGGTPAPIAAAPAPLTAAAPAPLAAAQPAPAESAAPPMPVASAQPAASNEAPAKPSPVVVAPRKVARPAARKPKPAPATELAGTTDTAGTKSPANEPNPYDVKLEDEAPAARPRPVDDSGLADAIRSEVSASADSQAPGF